MQNNFQNQINSNRIIVTDQFKAKKFTLDCRVFVRSLNDAMVCVKQIAQINTTRALYYNYISALDSNLLNKRLILAKFCDHDLCTPNIIAASTLKSYEVYFLMKFSVNLFLSHHKNLEKANDYTQLSKELDYLQDTLYKDLKSYVEFLKLKNFLN